MNLPRRALGLCILVMIMAAASGAHAGVDIDANADTVNNPVRGDTAWGTRGLRLLDLAIPGAPNTLGLAIGVDVATASSLFYAGDSEVFQTDRAYLLWSTPLKGLELALGYGFVTSTYKSFVNHQVQLLGEPALRIKYSHPVPFGGTTLRLGGLLEAQVPANPAGGMAFSGTSTQAQVLATWMLGDHLALHAQLGYRNDRSATANPNGTPDQRLAFGIDGFTNHVLWGLGLLAAWAPGDRAVLAPFLEFSANHTPNLGFTHNPMQASVGLKIRPAHSNIVEGTLGIDTRIAHAPASSIAWPGPPPWTAFAALTVHLSYISHDAPVAPTCSKDGECAVGERCMSGQCQAVVVETAHEAAPPPPTFVVRGTVHDANSLFIPPHATIRLSSREDTEWVVDPNTGRFESQPMPVGDANVLLRATAEGYGMVMRTLPLPKPGDVVEIDIVLQRDLHVPHGTFHATLIDARTMGPVLGATVRVGIEQKIDCDNAGICHDHVITGTYHVIITAAGYNTEDVRVVITEGTETDIDLQMQRSKKKLQAPTSTTGGKSKVVPKQPHTKIKKSKKKKK